MSFLIKNNAIWQKLWINMNELMSMDASRITKCILWVIFMLWPKWTDVVFAIRIWGNDYAYSFCSSTLNNEPMRLLILRSGMFGLAEWTSDQHKCHCNYRSYKLYALINGRFPISLFFLNAYFFYWNYVHRIDCREWLISSVPMAIKKFQSINDIIR